MRILQRANQKYCEDPANSQNVYSGLWAPNLPRLETFPQYEVSLSLDLFKNLRMSGYVLHDMQCNPCMGLW